MNRAQAQFQVKELTPIEVVEAVAGYFDSLASEVVLDAAEAEPEVFACAVDFWKTCGALAGELRLAIGKYEDAVLAHLNSNCTGH